MSDRRAIARHPGRSSPVVVGWGWFTGLFADGWRSISSLGVDGLLAIMALGASAIALAPFTSMAEIDGFDAGVVWQGLYLLACLRLFQVKGIDWPLWLLRRHSWLCFFLLIAMLSTLWSDDPRVSLTRSAALVGTTVVGVCIGALPSQRTLMAAWMWGLTVLVIVSFALYLSAPETGDLWVVDWDGRYRGFGTGKNHTGKYLAFGATLFTAATIKGTIDRSLGVAITAIYLIAAGMTESTTSLLALAAGIGAIVGIALTKRLGLSVSPVLALMGIAILVVGTLGILYVEDLTGLLGKKATLSGRTLLWAATIDTIAHQPLLGYGYFAIWSGEETNELLNAFTEQDFHWSTVPHAHNGFLQVAVDLGVPVAVLVAAYVIACLTQAVGAFHRDDSAFTLFAVGFVVSFIVMNIGELDLLRNRSGIWIAFVAITVALARAEAHRRRAAPDPPTALPAEQVATPLAVAQLRQSLRLALPTRDEGGAAGLTALRRQMESALRRRHGDPKSRLEEVRHQLRQAILQRHRPGLLRLARLRRELRRALPRRHGRRKGDGWSVWSALRSPPRKALTRADHARIEDHLAAPDEDRASSTDQPDSGADRLRGRSTGDPVRRPPRDGGN